MQPFYSHCIFCFAELPPFEVRGRGDHIFPEHILGTICTKDVCVGCNNMFGSEVDHLILEDRYVLPRALNR